MKSCCETPSIENNEVAGNSYCTNCGVVQAENNITSEITFVDNANGGKATTGQNVTFGQTGPGGKQGVGSTYHSTAAEITESRARLVAKRIATNLNLGDTYVDTAIRFFKLGLPHNFSRGRKAEITLGVCLYAACRIERTSHMLIDFTDPAQASVYKLGAAFVKLITLLNLDKKIPLVDPSLYIHRFAAVLGFGDKQHAVAGSALRLISRMNRDFMVTGRRPAGICGASLLIAARMHHFNRTLSQITKVVRMSSETIKKRLDEFSNTESGNLPVGDFNRIMLETEEDPPAFKKNFKIKGLNVKSPTSTVVTPQQNNSAECVQNIPKAAESQEEDAIMSELELIELENDLNEKVVEENIKELANQTEAALNDTEKKVYQTWVDNKEGDENLSDLDDDVEIQGVFLNEEEVNLKTERWTTENPEYTRKQEEKREREEEEKRNGIVKKVKRGPKPKPIINADNAADAAVQYLNQTQSKKISTPAIKRVFKIPKSLKKS